MKMKRISKPWLADLHMHTNASDGFPAVRDLLDYVADQGRLDVIAITDHDTLESSLWAYERRAGYPFELVPGVEVTSRDGHILGLWITQSVPRDLSVEETVAAIHERGGLAVIAHPYEIFVHYRAAWRYLRQPEVLLQAGIDAIEVHNSGAPTPGGNLLSRRLAQNLQLPMIGNSDAHTLTAIGCGVTRFEGHTAVDLRKAIENGQTKAEGRPWPIIDYLKLLPVSTRRRSSVSLETNMP
jgi:predicted metal-dependent phosphoesterase TrpH